MRKIRESSFQVHGGKLFNALPKELRDAKFTSVEEFKAELDAFLANVPDQPNVPGVHYTPVACDLLSGKPSNSIIDQIRHISVNKVRQQQTTLRRPGV